MDDQRSPLTPMDVDFTSALSTPLSPTFTISSSPQTSAGSTALTTPLTSPNHLSFLARPPSHTSRRALENAAFREKLRQMRLPLAPLVRLDSGTIHPLFPSTLLKFWLLTDPECEELAHFYHQRTPSGWTRQYPCPITWDSGLTLEEKRRKLGKFIGMRGCETPKTEEQLVREAREARLREDHEMYGRKTW